MFCFVIDNKQKMQLQTQMYWGVVVHFVICFCLVGFSAAKCDPEKCGSSNVSYPFWIRTSHCGHPEFQINCIEDEDTMALFFPVSVGNDSSNVSNGETTYYKIWDFNPSGYIVINASSLKASSCWQSEKADAFNWFASPGPFYFSESDRFVVVGSNTTGNYTYGEGQGEASCAPSVGSPNYQPYCRYGCCEITLPPDYWWIKFTSQGGNPLNDGPCGFSTIMDPSTFRGVDNKTDLSWIDVRKAYYGLRLNWGIGYNNCSIAKNFANYSCSSNAECIDSPSGIGYVCKCLRGYEGDGYSNGTDCTKIDECSAQDLNKCVKEDDGGVCHNLAGSYDCSCAKGYKGDGFRNGSRCQSESSNKNVIFAVIGSVSAFVGVSIGARGLIWWLRKHYQKQARDENFRINGGFLLEKILEEKGNQTEGKLLRIFSEELKRASQNYSNDMKLGSGGSSTVYKGILSNGTAVAIKRFKEFPIGVESQETMKQFINEIVILSGLHHRNVVSLVGCCLQTQAPILVYEFVEGGTISHQLRFRRLSWESRLQIAMGSADALAYLHSGLNHHIIHRDVKSSNILLDNAVTPKIADFGISRLVGGNDTHLNTNLMGTCGYIDPEYFGTGLLTDKSDVFSFGVFLAELLTGREPLSRERRKEEMLLTQFFLSKCNDNSLTDILDQNAKNEENQDQMIAVATLASECLFLEGSRRPSMREVKIELERIEGSRRLAA